jgi:PAS domain S-box-containing protein
MRIIRLLYASLRARLVLLVLLALMPAFVLVLYGDEQQRRLETHEMQDNALRLARTVAFDQLRTLDAAHQLLAALAQLAPLHSQDMSACNVIMADLLKHYPAYANLGAADLSGNVFCSGVPLNGPVNIGDRTYFTNTLQTRDFTIGEYQIGRISGAPGLTVSLPVVSQSQGLEAVVFAAIDMNWFNQVSSAAQVPAGTVLRMTDAHRVILARQPDPEKWVGTTVSDTFLLQAMETQQDEASAEDTGVDGIARLFALVTVRDAAHRPIAYVDVGIPTSIAFAEIDQALARNLVVLGLATLLAAVAAWYFGNLFVLKSIHALTQTTTQLRAGNLNARTGQTYSESEFGQLERRLDETATMLQQREAERVESEAELRKWAGIFQNSQVGILIIAADGRTTTFNPALGTLLGYTPEELKQKRIDELQSPAARVVFTEQMRIAQEKGHHTFESECLRKDGTTLLLYIDATDIKDERGNTLYQVATAQDIGQLRRTEMEEREQRVLAEALHDTAAALNSTLNFDEVLNRVLDNVGRVVTHDAVDIMLVESDVARPIGSRGYAEHGVETWLLQQRFKIEQFPRMQQMLETGQPNLIKDAQGAAEWVNIPETRWIRSLIGIPIRVKARVIGFLNVISTTPGFFDETHLARLETFADQVAISLENARLLAESEQRANQFGSLYELARDLATQADLQGLLETIIDRAIVLLGAPCGFIYLYDASKNDLELAVEKGFEVPVGTRLKMGEGMAGRVAQDRQPLLVDDYQSWENRAAIYHDARYKAVVEVPMVIGGELIGVLGVAQLDATSRSFTEADAHLLALFAGQGASTVRNARLLEETEHRASEFAALYQTTNDLSSQQDLPTLLETIVERAVKLLAASGGGMYLYDAPRGDLVVTITTHASTPVGTRLRLGQGMAGRVAQTRQPLIVDDYQNWDTRAPQYEGTPITAILEVPMLYGGQLIGVLVVEEVGVTARKFTEEDTRLLSLFAAHGASAVHNARLLQETRTRAEQLGLLYDAGLALNSVLDPRVQLEFLFKIATKALNAERAEFFRFDPAQNRLGMEMNVGYTDEKIREAESQLSFSLDNDRGLVSSVARERVPINVGDLREDMRWVTIDPAIRSGIWVPVQHENELRGVLCVLSVRPNAFSAQDERLLVLFANQVATAMENAHLFEVQSQRSAELEALHAASLRVTSTLDLPQVLEQIIAQSLKLVSATNAHIFLYDGTRLTFGAAIWADAVQRHAFSEPRENGITYRVARTGIQVVVPDTSRDPLYGDQSWESGAILSLPLKAGEKVRGVMNVAFDRAHQFDDNELRVLELLADQATIALENARLFGETRRHADRLAVVNHIASAVNQTLDMDKLVEVIYQEISATFAPDAFFIALYDPVKNELDYRLDVDEGVREPPRRRSLESGFGAQVIKTQQPLLVRNWEKEKDRLPPVVLAGSMKPSLSWLGVPMRIGDASIGIIGVESYKPNAYDEADERLLITIADQVAVVIQNVRLFEETRRRAERLAVLNRIGRAVSQTLELDELLRTIYKEVTAVLTVQAFFIAFYDPVTNELDFRIQVDEGVNETPMRLPVKEGLSARVIATKKPILVHNRPLENQFPIADPTLWGSMKRAVSWLGVPMLISDKVVGILSVQAYSPNAYGEEEERLLATIADQVSVAVQNARLFDETRRRLNDLEAVNTISIALRLAKTVEEMVPLLLDETLRVFNLTAGQIALHDPAADEMRVVAARGWCIDSPKIAQSNDGIAGLVFETGQPYVTREFKSDSKTSQMALGKIPEGWGGAIIPIRTGHEVTGVFAVSEQLPREITTNEVRLLTLIAEIAGNAIHRAMLHEQTEQRLRRLDALHMIDTAIGASLDLRVTLDILLDQVLTQLRVDATSVLLLNPYTQSLEYTAGRGFRTNAIERVRVRMGQEYAGSAAIERRVLFSADLPTAGVSANYADLITSEGVVSYCAAPLISKGQIKGVLEVFHRSALRPDSEWLDFIETLAGQTAIAIENAALFNSLQQSNFDISLAYDATIEGWAHALGLRDREGGEQTPRVTELTLRLARALGVRDPDLVHIRRGALLHDIGKMGIPDSILIKRGTLTDDEEPIIRQHPTLAWDLLSPITYLRPAIDIPYCHHENWDGTGYPRGLKGEQIPLAARTFAVADAWSDLRREQPGRAKLSFDAAQQCMRDRSNTWFDPRIVETLFTILEPESD